MIEPVVVVLLIVIQGLVSLVVFVVPHTVQRREACGLSAVVNTVHI
jgi:hypothetical protein